ncbi:hypothetical protein CBB2_2590 [Clostridium botulinum]|uniref:hypothetical protein n=1 Tax=Clostridium botulinum TaxID=1491 RepID=UPI000581E51E|nr:hypothetical protein [Clostridium botulinum]BAQ14700.1 hypothetical protein CBB2_2590 [Clostridium botulinum]
MEEYKHCEVCGRLYPEKHHIVSKSQGGLDFFLNFKYLCVEHHKGKKSPHMCKKIDLEYKKELQAKLKNKLIQDYYTENELIKILELNRRQVKKMCRKFLLYKEGYKTEDIIRRLMGGKLY